MKAKSSTYRLSSAVAAAAALALLASCGGGSAPGVSETSPEPEAGAPGAVEACGLLTAGEIEEVMGSAPGESQAGGAGECSWPSTGAPGPLVHVQVSPSSLDSYEAFVLRYQTEFGGEEPPPEYYAPVEGIGDWAMFRADDGALEVHVGGRMVRVATTPPEQDRAMALARMALSRLRS